MSMLKSINQKDCRQLAIFVYYLDSLSYPLHPKMCQSDIKGGGNNYADSCFEHCCFMKRCLMGHIFTS